MSAATSVFMRAFYAAAAGAVSRAGDASRGVALRGLAAAVIAGSAVAPAMAESYESQNPGGAAVSVDQGGAPSALLPTAGGVVDGVVQIGQGVGTVFSGFGRYLAGATGAVASIGASSAVVATPGVVVSAGQAGRLGPEQQAAFDQLAVNGAAHRLVAEAAYESFANAREAFALSPKNQTLARTVIGARKSMEREVAALNVAIAEFGNATKVLAQRYTTTNFSPYKALHASISSPIEMRSGEVAPNKPIYAAAEKLAIQIVAGEAPRATVMVPGGNAAAAVVGEGVETRRLAYRSQ